MSKKLWQPMREAPKDGTWIAAYDVPRQAPITVRFQFMRGLKGGAWVDTNNNTVPTESLEAFYPLPGILQDAFEDFSDHSAYTHFVQMLKASADLYEKKIEDLESEHADQMAIARDRLAMLPIYSEGVLKMQGQVAELEREVERLKGSSSKGWRTLPEYPKNAKAHHSLVLKAPGGDMPTFGSWSPTRQKWSVLCHDYKIGPHHRYLDDTELKGWLWIEIPGKEIHT